MNHTPKKRILVSLGLWNSIHLHFYITKPEKKRKKFSQRSPLQRTFVWHTVKDWIQHRIFDCFLFHLTCHELIYSELIFKRKTYFLSRTEWNWFFFYQILGNFGSTLGDMWGESLFLHFWNENHQKPRNEVQSLSETFVALWVTCVGTASTAMFLMLSTLKSPDKNLVFKMIVLLSVFLLFY